MPDILEAVKNVVQSFLDEEPKSPLHVGEVMFCWSCLAELSEDQIHTEAGINSTTDPELSQAFHEGVKLFKSQKDRLAAFLKTEGIPLPPLSESKPNSDSHDIPLGVKLTDNELANSLIIKFVMGISTYSNAITQSTCNDVIPIWTEFLQEDMTFGATLKSLMKKRGWFKDPPIYYPPRFTDSLTKTIFNSFTISLKPGYLSSIKSSPDGGLP